MPVGAETFREALRMGAEVFHALKKVLVKRKLAHRRRRRGRLRARPQERRGGDHRHPRGDRGGGLRAGQARSRSRSTARRASCTRTASTRSRRAARARKDAAGMVELYTSWIEKYPIVSIEDGLAEDDWDGWASCSPKRSATAASSSATTCSSRTPSGSRAASRRASRNSILIKVNQIGTLTETLEAIEMARSAGYLSVISHRSGETEDTFIADLAVGTGAGQIKTGSAVAHGPRREVQPAAAHRGAARRRGRVSGRRDLWDVRFRSGSEKEDRRRCGDSSESSSPPVCSRRSCSRCREASTAPATSCGSGSARRGSRRRSTRCSTSSTRCKRYKKRARDRSRAAGAHRARGVRDGARQEGDPLSHRRAGGEGRLGEARALSVVTRRVE